MPVTPTPKFPPASFLNTSKKTGLRFDTNHWGKPLFQIDFPNGYTVSVIQNYLSFYNAAAWPTAEPSERSMGKSNTILCGTDGADCSTEEVAAFIQMIARKKAWK